MSPQAVTPSQARGNSADMLEEVQITARYVGPDAQRANARLDNNPVNPIYQTGASRTPDEVRAAEAVAASPSGVIETVVSTAPQWRPGEMVIYQDLMTAALIRGQDFNEDYASAQAQDTYRANMRRQADNFLIDTFTPYGQVKNAVAGVWNLGVKAAGGVASLPYLLDSADAARAVQDWFGGARVDVDAPLADMVSRSLAPAVNEVRTWSEDTLGIGGSVFLGAAAEFALDTAAVLPATAGLRRLTPQGEIALYSRTGQLTGNAKFDQLFAESAPAANILRGLERRGVTVVDDGLRLDPGASAQLLRENGRLTLVYDSQSTSFVDMLHEARHVAQVQRVEAAGVLGEKNFFSSPRLLGAAERGAYEYELRLGARFGFSKDYNAYLRDQIRFYYPPGYSAKFSASPTMRTIFNVMEPRLTP